MSSGDKTTEQIIEDRIFHLFEMFKVHPIHSVCKKFKDLYSTSINSSDMQKIYKIWFDDHVRHNSVPLRNLRKTDWWSDIEARIKKQATKDLSSFIYNHWKKAGNR